MATTRKPKNTAESDTTVSRAVVTEKDGVATIDATAFMAQMKALEARVGLAEDRAASAEAEAKALREQLESAEVNGFYMDEFGNKVPCLTAAMQQGNSQVHDKPGTVLEKLDNMEKIATARGDKFDRERTRKVLMGEPVEDFCKYRCPDCGRAEERWNDNEDAYLDHVDGHQRDRKASYRGRRKVRAVDEARA